jgi:hypothetical protein
MRPSSRMQAVWYRAGLLTAALIGALAPATRADVAPPDLRGCERRPIGATCYVEGKERGVCAKDPTGDRPMCLVFADPSKAPPPPTAPDPPATVPPEPVPRGQAPDPVAGQPSSSSCAAGQSVGSGGAAAALVVALLLAGLPRRSRVRRAKAGPA